jgi:phospholipid/cholesterol/gamma-HCH transport system ATP-binding protein
MLDKGKIRFEGTPEEIRRCDDPLVQQFIQGIEKPRDALTGMATQLQGERRFQEELARLQSDQVTFSAVMLTIENLEELNEKIGHVTKRQWQINKEGNFVDQIVL